ncbi:uncharacterized protein HMPREF1120_04731 [Exophiala dermatitidis NIH/UT8656]|uniref:Uncharacterized protein n=1 Tax=Exophiala dermatitidis (strain ATCC 34100 / CBS 525.76 / NIH/UT8656) TaxID=858893 RepID=H6BY88_EXODN|nr:uncharacterized protein HMPREF1120_04731 [Exophiala dermatitidis NIH/UT8656]EHY56656.1 hypothetical protein HMPREF1120_04731 [Exophiala dermatitidis NIH/UT8656]
MEQIGPSCCEAPSASCNRYIYRRGSTDLDARGGGDVGFVRFLLQKCVVEFLFTSVYNETRSKARFHAGALTPGTRSYCSVPCPVIQVTCYAEPHLSGSSGKRKFDVQQQWKSWYSIPQVRTLWSSMRRASHRCSH